MGKFTTRFKMYDLAMPGRPAQRNLRSGLCAALVFCSVLSACGGGGGGSSPSASGAAGSGAGSGGVAIGSAPVTAAPPLPPPNNAQAARFLAQATYGVRAQDLPVLTAQGYYTWLDAQMAMPATAQLPLINASSDPASRNTRMAFWWQTAVSGPDQLRQRVALALSEIMVISDQSGMLQNNGAGVAAYWDLLANDAFGNYRKLLEDVTLSPAMGTYLNMLGNQKPDPAHNIHADENFAREVMQLFTIGLYQLNPDGTVVKDSSGVPVPSYSQSDVTNLARVFTGWSFNSTNFFYGAPNYFSPMIAFEAEHDTGAKTIVGGVTVPANGTAHADLVIALDTLFNHPNTPPFISRQLIQRLVTSNPTPAYVQRVAQVFINDGQGVRGNLGAVVRAILLDAEARSDAMIVQPSYGKRREPLLTATQLWRALDGHDANGQIQFWNPEYNLHQAPLSAASVFNFFKPAYSPPGALKAAGLVAPEFQLVNASNLTLLHNFFRQNILGRGVANTYTQPTDILLHPSPWLPLAAGTDSGPLIDQMNLVLMAGQMSPAMRQTLVTAVNAVPATDGGINRVCEAAFLIFTSQQFQTQR